MFCRPINKFNTSAHTEGWAQEKCSDRFTSQYIIYYKNIQNISVNNNFLAILARLVLC